MHRLTEEEILRQVHAELSAPNPTDWKAFEEMVADGTVSAMTIAMQQFAKQECEEINSLLRKCREFIEKTGLQLFDDEASELLSKLKEI